MNIETAKYIDARNHLLESPCVSYWLKKALRALDGRDPVDALKDIEALWHVANNRVSELEPTNADVQAGEARLGA
ncbi:hypothetical protein [uncultured Limnobacter sp.]|uniref:hypothetical protein n=1 Tax=uncultured Limnobacter sp. TaxID=199681 RepID=UPI0032B13063|tara:strand:- start:525 stop:749 length:225 start_codon:yes stop_codon:yes gene_type:complete